MERRDHTGHVVKLAPDCQRLLVEPGRHSVLSMVDRSKALNGGLRNLQYGRIHREVPLMAQAQFVYELIGEGLASYGCSFADVTHQTVYLVDVGDYPALERMAILHYGRRFPPTTVVPILGASPFRETLLEIEVTAVAGN